MRARGSLRPVRLGAPRHQPGQCPVCASPRRTARLLQRLRRWLQLRIRDRVRRLRYIALWIFQLGILHALLPVGVLRQHLLRLWQRTLRVWIFEHVRKPDLPAISATEPAPRTTSITADCVMTALTTAASIRPIPSDTTALTALGDIDRTGKSAGEATTTPRGAGCWSLASARQFYRTPMQGKR